MKKLFSKKMVFVYGGLSVCAVIGFIVTIVMVIDFNNLHLLPIDLVPATHVVHPLFFAGVIFGGLAVLCRWGMNKSTVSIIFTVGILLTGIFELYWGVLLFGELPRRLTDVVIYGEKVRNYNLGHGVVVAQTLCVWDGYDGYLIDVYEGTKIYEQDGVSRQKQQVGLDAFQPGQVVDINGRKFVNDPEIQAFINSLYDGRGIDYTVFLGAVEITIRKGESAPVENDDCYGFMSEP